MKGDGGFEWVGAASKTSYDLGEELDNRTVPAGTNLLVVGPPMAGTRRFGMELLAAEHEDRPIIVTNRESARTIRSDHADCLDGPVGVIDCVTKQGGEPRLDSPSVRYVASPDDLTGVGMQLTDLLAGSPDGTSGGERVLFDSVSTLLMYSDVERTTRFLDVVTARIEEQDAIGLFALNSLAHEDEAYERLCRLFDGVVRLDDRGVADVKLPEA
ncbi:MAG: RAD55 family ATPase [Natronomonas sp.]